MMVRWRKDYDKGLLGLAVIWLIGGGWLSAEQGMQVPFAILVVSLPIAIFVCSLEVHRPPPKSDEKSK